MVLFLTILSGCTRNKIDLLFSESMEDYGTFEPATYLTSYSDFTDLNYPITVDASIFSDHILFTYTFLNANIGSDLFTYHSYEISDRVLTISIEETQSVSSPSFGNYVMIFSIALELYEQVDEVTVELI
jgi:hypothetical protein